MPIYEYRCDSCGFQKEYLLRMSDAPLTDCPECKKATFNKMVTAAGFQLKGGGWYVTDFKGGNNAAGSAKKTESNQLDTSGKPDSAAAASSAADKPKSDAVSSSSSTPSSTGTS